MAGFLNNVMNFGRAFCNSTIRTSCACLGRRRSMADFNTLVNSSPISKDKSKHTMNDRALNPPKERAKDNRNEQRVPNLAIAQRRHEQVERRTRPLSVNEMKQ